MKKILTFLFALMLLVPAMAFAGAPAEITEQKKEVAGFNASYPRVAIAGNNAVAAKINQTIDGVVNERLGWCRTTEEEKPTTYGITYAVGCNDGEILSFNMGYYVTNKETDRIYFYDGMTFDMRTGKLLKWKDVVAKADEPYMTKDRIRLILRKGAEKGIYRIYSEAEDIDRMPQNFYVDPARNIHFQFEPGKLSEYKEGVVDVDMGRKAVLPVLKKEE